MAKVLRSFPELSDFHFGHGDRSSDVSEMEPSHTRQEFAEECDINTIMKRYQATGVVSHVDPRQPFYLPEGPVPDLMTALQVMKDAETAFMSLPAEVRREFDNDAMKFVEFASDKENLDQMREWGLAPPAPAPAEPVPGELIETVPPPPKGKSAKAPPAPSEGD